MLTRSEAEKQGFTIDDTAAGRPVGYKGPRFEPNEMVYIYTELEEQLVDIVQNLEAFTSNMSEVEVLTIYLKRGGPLHKLWQDLHLKKYPENY